jgi:hypothetical protein
MAKNSVFGSKDSYFWSNFRFKPLFRAKCVIYPSGKEKPATGLKMGKTKKAGENPANP